MSLVVGAASVRRVSRRSSRSFVAITALLTAPIGCGKEGSDRPESPEARASRPTLDTARCRTFPKSAKLRSSDSESSYTCAWASGTGIRCDYETHANFYVVRGTLEVRYASVKDFVSEGRMPGLRKATGVTRTLVSSKAPLMFGPNTLQYTYDQSGRLLEVKSDNIVRPPSVPTPDHYLSTTTFEEWDEQGRPVRGAVGPFLRNDEILAPASRIEFAYDARAKTVTETRILASGKREESRASWDDWSTLALLEQEGMSGRTVEIGATDRVCY